jgi:hypothetical protein
MALVTLGCDVGARYVGWAVLDDTLLAHGVWDLRETPDGWTPEAYLGHQAAQTLAASGVELLALELFHWRKDKPALPQASAVQRCVGALLSLGRPPLQVRTTTAATWMRDVMGTLPGARLWGSHTWKVQVRRQTGLLLGYAWPPARPSDPAAFHDSDAAGIALYARNVALMAARIRASERR